jgi:hypothetical protein
MSKKDLIPITKRSPEEAYDICRKGAESLNRLKKQRKTMAAVAAEMLNATVAQRRADLIGKMDELGFDGKRASYLAVVIQQVFSMVLDPSVPAADRLKAAELLRKMTDGDAQTLTINTEEPVEVKIAKMLKNA